MTSETPPKMNLPMKKRNANSHMEHVLGSPSPLVHGNEREDVRIRQASESSSTVDDGLNGPLDSSGLAEDCPGLRNVYAGPAPMLQAPGVFPNVHPDLVAAPSFLQPKVPLSLNNQPLLQPEQQGQGYNVPSLLGYSSQGLGAEPLKWIPISGNPLSSSQNSSASGSSISGSSSYPQVAFAGIQSDSSQGSNVFGISQQPLPSTLLCGPDSRVPALGHISDHIVVGPTTTGPQPHDESSHHVNQTKSLEDTRKEYEIISTQLSRLDRYMALNCWKLTSRNKKPLIERRMTLVRNLDTVRCSKEQLELESKKPNLGASVTSKSNSAEFPATSTQHANSQAMPMAWPSGILSSYPPAALYAPTFSNSTFTQPLLNNETFDTTFPWKGRESVQLFDPGLGLANAHIAMSNGNTYGADSGPLLNNWNGKEYMQRNGHVPTSGSAEKEQVTDSCTWETPKRAPSNIHRIYRQIAEALGRNQSVEGLLQELASVTARNARENNDSRGSPERPVRMKIPQATDHHDSQASQGSNVHANANQIKQNSGAAYVSGKHSEAVFDPQLRVRTLGSQHALANSFNCETSNRDDDTVSSSYMSSNLWDTIQESDIEVNTPTPSARRAGPDLSGRRNWVHEEPKVKRPYESILPANSIYYMQHNAQDNNPIHGYFHPQHLRAGNGLQPGLAFPKTAPAVAVQQEVNAHAFVPSFGYTVGTRNHEMSQ